MNISVKLYLGFYDIFQHNLRRGDGTDAGALGRRAQRRGQRGDARHRHDGHDVRLDGADENCRRRRRNRRACKGARPRRPAAVPLLQKRRPRRESHVHEHHGQPARARQRGHTARPCRDEGAEKEKPDRHRRQRHGHVRRDQRRFHPAHPDLYRNAAVAVRFRGAVRHSSRRLGHVVLRAPRRRDSRKAAGGHVAMADFGAWAVPAVIAVIVLFGFAPQSAGFRHVCRRCKRGPAHNGFHPADPGRAHHGRLHAERFRCA